MLPFNAVTQLFVNATNILRLPQNTFMLKNIKIIPIYKVDMNTRVIFASYNYLNQFCINTGHAASKTAGIAK